MKCFSGGGLFGNETMSEKTSRKLQKKKGRSKKALIYNNKKGCGQSESVSYDGDDSLQVFKRNWNEEEYQMHKLYNVVDKLGDLSFYNIKHHYEKLMSVDKPKNGDEPQEEEKHPSEDEFCVCAHVFGDNQNLQDMMQMVTNK